MVSLTEERSLNDKIHMQKLTGDCAREHKEKVVARYREG